MKVFLLLIAILRPDGSYTFNAITPPNAQANTLEACEVSASNIMVEARKEGVGLIASCLPLDTLQIIRKFSKEA
jgi:hypothetical protein